LLLTNVAALSIEFQDTWAHTPIVAFLVFQLVLHIGEVMKTLIEIFVLILVYINLRVFPFCILGDLLKALVIDVPSRLDKTECVVRNKGIYALARKIMIKHVHI